MSQLPEIFMCGIAGISQEGSKDILDDMNAALYHRGPDSGGTYMEEGKVYLGMRRLAIIGIEDGIQPMASSCGRYIIVFNGEVFNSPELRVELERKGHIFRTKNSDTESLLMSYIEWGENCTEKLNGMYAFVIYDKPRSMLFGARDFFGIKPLYIHCSQKGFAFASEIRSLLLVPWIGKRFRSEAVEDYLRLQYSPPTKTVFEDVMPLMPGGSFTYSLVTRQLSTNGRRRLIQNSVNNKSVMDTNELYWQLSDAIKRWTTSERPLGYSLSGGLDSGLLVAIGQKVGNLDAKTWTVQFEKESDEADLASLLAKKLGIEHTTIEITATDVVKELDNMVEAMEEPYGGGVPSWFVYKEASKSVKVIMTGTGGDEIFGNYEKWRYFQKRKPGFWKAVYKSCIEGGNGRIYNAWTHLYPTKISEKELQRLLYRQELETLKCDIAKNILRVSDFNNSEDYIAELDSKLQLPGEFLNMTDRFSMYWSLEARCPFLDLELTKYVFSHSTKARTGSARSGYKHQLKQLAKVHLPYEYICAPKRGFGNKFERIYNAIPREELSYLYSDAFITMQGIFSIRGLGDLVTKWATGEKDGYEKLWTLFMFQKWWFKRYIK